MEILSIKRSVTAAELIAMYAGGTPANGKELLPAPGTGKVILVHDVIFNYTGGTAFTGGGAIGAYMGAVLQTGTLAAATLVANGAVSSINRLIAASGAVAENTKVTLSNASAAFAAGTGTAEVTITFSIVKL
jgi:hypothetical protein